MPERGRPSEYRQTFCREVIDLMASGLSLTAAGADLGFAKQTMHNWMEAHPEFMDAVKIGQAKRQLFLERRLFAADQGPVVTSSIFALKNTGTGDWRDRQEVEHSGGVAVKTSRELSDDELAAIAAGSGMGASSPQKG